ncbi:MAG: polysaccharide deacetylase family protein [Nanoarchaeota archaeon]
MINLGNIIFHGDRNKKQVALTFDDSPSEETSKILNLLKKEKIMATFFVIGRKTFGREKIIRRIINEGHEIGNHSYSHKKLLFIGYKSVKEEIAKCDRLLRDKFNLKTNLFRPPYFKFGLNAWIASFKLKKRVIFADVVSEDWKLKGIDFAVYNVLKRVRNGSIINLHDYLEDIGRNKQIVKITKEIISRLKSKKYNFVTVSKTLN